MKHPIFVLLIVIVGYSTAQSAPDDNEAKPGQAQVEANMMVGAIDESNFDRWIFPGASNAGVGRSRMASQMKLKLAEIDRLCALTDAQRQKLELAARGDMKRFFDQVEDLRKKFLAVRHDQNAIGQIYQEISPLQSKQSNGIFGEDSLFAKTLQKTLNTEQRASYSAAVNERLRFRYRASVEVTIATLETSAVAMRHEQRQALIKFMLEETQTPKAFGQYENYLILYQLSTLPEEKVKPLFSEHQWKALQQQLMQARGMKQFLVERGMLAVDGDR